MSKIFQFLIHKYVNKSTKKIFLSSLLALETPCSTTGDRVLPPKTEEALEENARGAPEGDGGTFTNIFSCC